MHLRSMYEPHPFSNMALKHGGAIKIRDGILFSFYMGLPHISSCCQRHIKVWQYTHSSIMGTTWYYPNSKIKHMCIQWIQDPFTDFLKSLGNKAGNFVCMTQYTSYQSVQQWLALFLGTAQLSVFIHAWGAWERACRSGDFIVACYYLHVDLFPQYLLHPLLLRSLLSMAVVDWSQLQAK